MRLCLPSGRAPAGSAWRWLVPATAIAFVGCQEDPLPSEPEVVPTGPPSLSVQAADATGVDPDDWIVVFKDGTPDPPGLARRLAAEHGGSIRYTYSHALLGFAGRFPPASIEGIGRNPNVAYVEPDGVAYATAVGSWGLDRIDQRNLPLDGSYSPTGDGSGVDAWIIDTGIDYGRTDQFDSFDLSRDWDFITGDDDATDNCHGHGTHVAGTVGSNDYGVASDVTIIGVRVLACSGSGSWSGVIAGINHVVQFKSGPTVANMSLGGGYSASVNQAVTNAVAAGVVMAVAAGNENSDACNRSPASTPAAITVGASTSSDNRSSFSNYGSCVDLFAPGSAIVSTFIGTGTTRTWNGTSMATPHVTGAAALVLQGNPGWSPNQVWTAIQGNATAGVLSGVNGSPNLLLWVEPGGAAPDPGCGTSCPDALVQSISDATVTFGNGNRARGRVTVQIVDENAPLAGATVNGTWTVDGIPGVASSSGTTGTGGTVDLQTGWIRGASSFVFCVTDVSAPDHGDGSNGECSPYPAGALPPEPDPDPGAGAPTGLTGSYTPAGRNWKVNLAWDGGAATVDIERDGVVRATVSNVGSYTENVGKDNPSSFVYRVCNAGTDMCSNTYP